MVLRGKLDDRPDQLNCDALKLELVPGEKPTPAATSARTKSPAPTARDLARDSSPAQSGAGAKTNPDSVSLAEPESTGGTRESLEPAGADAAGETEKKGLFGDLTLQRAHATGHAVWLYLPANGVKLRCNELIHKRRAPYKPDQTYFRGDVTRPLDLEKIDVVQEGPDKGKVSSITRIRTVDATLLDRGYGLDTADVVASGPGRLETQPDRDHPVERIAIWQDKLFVQNEVGPDGQLLRKIVHLTGSRPCFIDALRKTSLDSAYLITVWLKPDKTSAPASDKDILPTRPLAVAETNERRAVVPAALASAGQASAQVGRACRYFRP